MVEIRVSDNFEISVDYNRDVNYVSVFNGGKFCKSITVKNRGSRVINNIVLTIDGYYFQEATFEIPSIGAKKSVTIDCSNFKPSLDKLILLAEAVYSEISVTLSNKVREIDEFKIPVNIQAWNYWEADPWHYEEVASFVMPNHEYVVELIARVQDD